MKPAGRGFGWLTKGQRVTQTSDVKLGDVLLHYSAQFNAENTIRVSRFDDCRMYAYFVCPEDVNEYADTHPYEFCIWQWELATGDYWIAVKPIPPVAPQSGESDAAYLPF